MNGAAVGGGTVMPEQAKGFLSIREGEGAPSRRVPLKGDRMVVGRSPDVELQLDNASVSRQHAELFLDAFGRWWIKDLGSRNGTFVNGEVTQDEELLKAGDSIQIETFVLEYEAAEGADGARPRKAPTGAGLEANLEMTLAVSDAPESGSLQRLDQMAAPKIDSSHLSKLTEFSGVLLGTEDPLERVVELCRLMVGQPFQGNSAVAVRLDRGQEAEQEPKMLCEPVSGKNWRGGEAPYISRTMLREVMKSLVPIVASNTGAGGQDSLEISLAGSVMEMSAVACPIRVSDDQLDLMYVSFPGEFGTGEWLAMASLAADQYQQAEKVWEARAISEQQAVMEKDLARAERIQNGLIPDEIDIDKIEVGIGFEPCKWVGGDYVDVIERPDGKTYLVICDVCGKGLQAALITASLHTMMHMSVNGDASLPDLISRFNDYLCDTLPDESFVTAIGMILDRDTGDIETINCGHPPAMIVQKDGKVRELKASEHPPLGYVPFDFESEHAKVDVGELLSIFTDGLTELEDPAGNMLGIPGTGGCLERIFPPDKQSRTIDELTNDLTAQLDAFQADAVRPDDRTFMLVRRLS